MAQLLVLEWLGAQQHHLSVWHLSQWSSGLGRSVVRSYTTTNTSETEVIQTGLQCFTIYYIRVTVIGVQSLGTVDSSVQVLVGGKVTACVACSYCDQILSSCCLDAGWCVEHCYVSSDINAIWTMLHEWHSAMEFSCWLRLKSYPTTKNIHQRRRSFRQVSSGLHQSGSYLG